MHIDHSHHYTHIIIMRATFADNRDAPHRRVPLVSPVLLVSLVLVVPPELRALSVLLAPRVTM